MATFDASKLNLPFMKYHRAAIGLSALLILASIVLLSVKGLNYGVDFTGGVELQLEFAEPVEIEGIRETMTQVGQGQAMIRTIDNRGARNILIRYQSTSDDVRKQIMDSLEEKHGAVTIQKIDDVGPVVGREMRKQALIAVLSAIAFILIYMAFRFQFRFGVVAVISLVHDTILMLGVYSLTDREISTSFIAAILTVIGYSLNDSIVVLDRVRENWGQLRGKGILDLMNNSINQTLSRTINTSLTTLLPVLAMFFLGGELLSNLMFAFIVGIIVGTYSSVYVASALLAEWSLSRPLKK